MITEEWTQLEGFDGKYETDGKVIRNANSKRVVHPRITNGLEYYRLVKPDGKKCERSFFSLTGIGERKYRISRIDRSCEQEIIRLYLSGLSTYELGKNYNKSKDCIRKLLVRNGIKTRSRSETWEKGIKASKEANINKYCNEEVLICPECGKSFTTAETYKGIGTPSKYCSKQCTKKGNNRNKNQKRRNLLAESEDIRWYDLVKRDKGRCYICGERVDSEDFTINKNGVFIAGSKYPTVDHVIPLSKGGKNTMDNLRLAHFICNSRKGAK